MRVIGLDPGTISFGLCGLDDGKVFLDSSLPAREALADPTRIVESLAAAAPVALITGPSGYGLPLTPVQDLTENDLRLALLAPAGESGAIGGLGSLLRALARSSLPVVLTPGVVHLRSVPDHRKVNRVDMGTADKVAAAALGIAAEAARLGCPPSDVSFILVELGGAFTAALAVDEGRVVDGIGGTSGPIGLRAGGAMDGEVAYLAGEVTKRMLVAGGVASVAAVPEAGAAEFARPTTPRGHLAWSAYLEGVVKAVAGLRVSAPRARSVLLSGRLATVPGVADQVAARLADAGVQVAVRALQGFARAAAHAAQGAAVIADGLAGGRHAAVVDAIGIREARGSVLDHLYVISPDDARTRLGL
jgi:predicted butyrate kinase (DUF1464 family)